MAIFARQTLSLQRHINVRNCCFDRYFAHPGKYRIFIVSIVPSEFPSLLPAPVVLPNCTSQSRPSETLKFLFFLVPYPREFPYFPLPATRRCRPRHSSLLPPSSFCSTLFFIVPRFQSFPPPRQIHRDSVGFELYGFAACHVEVEYVS